MLKLTILIPWLFLMLPQQDKLVKTKVSDNITASLPTNFYPMTPQDLAQRFPSVRKPIAAYTDESTFVNFSVNVSATQWRPTDTEIAKDFFKSSVYNLYDKVEMHNEGIKEINKKDFIYFEFDAIIDGDEMSLNKRDAVRKYVYIQYHIVHGKTLVFSFTCPSQIKDKWQATAGEVMNSIKVKGM